MQRLGMPAGGSSIVALTVLEHADTHTEELASHVLAYGSAALTFQMEVASRIHLTSKRLSATGAGPINAFANARRL
jgi:hypothetical protein